jgi:hypothetical protein
MLLSSLLLIPLLGIFSISSNISYEDSEDKLRSYKITAFVTSIVNLILSLVIFILFDFSSNQFQFVQEHYDMNLFDVYLGVDGISIYFVLLTTIIMPIAILSNWNSITENVKSYLIIMLLLETLLLAVFLVLDILLFYIFFESILPPLFLLIGLFGSNNKVRASFYLFLYTFNLKCKRAKHRGSPKALVTKEIRETLSLAWLMPQGMVRSLVFIYRHLVDEKRPEAADIWVIAVLSHPGFKAVCKYGIDIQGVKEQRVDGSSNSRILDFVRCTLVAGKPVFGRKIHSHSYNSIIRSSMFKRSIHTMPNSSVRTTLNPGFITGLVDAEGCFTLGFFKSDKYKLGYQIQAIFKITLPFRPGLAPVLGRRDKKDFYLLSQVQDYFGVGKITEHGNTTLQYTVKSLKDLEIIITHFDKYPLLSLKWSDYTLFKDAISLIKSKQHLNKEGFIKVLSIKASINLGLSDELELNFPNIKPISRPLPPLLNKSIIDPNWIAGLASGDGCFHISIRNSSTTKLGKAIVLKFHIVQHSRDTELMEMLISRLGCGKIELKLKQSAVYFVVVSFKDIFEKIIPLFDKYPIKGVKALDFGDFKRIANLMSNKEHLTEQGLSKIQSIKSNMNLLRKL